MTDPADPGPLAAALDRAYAAFASAPPVRHLDACSHCWTEPAAARVAATPPRDLSDDDARRLATDLALVVGDARAVRWYAPRLLDRMTSQPPWTDADVVAGALLRGGWPAWPAAEVEAVRAVLAAWWARALDARGGDVAGVLAAVARLDPDVSPRLAAWDALPARPRALALLDFIEAEGDALRSGVPDGAWAASPGAFACVRAFVTDPARLVEAAGALGDPAVARSREILATWLDVLAA